MRLEKLRITRLNLDNVEKGNVTLETTRAVPIEFIGEQTLSKGVVDGINIETKIVTFRVKPIGPRTSVDFNFKE